MYVYSGNRLSPTPCARYQLEVFQLEFIVPDVSHISTATPLPRLGFASYINMFRIVYVCTDLYKYESDVCVYVCMYVCVRVRRLE